MSPIPINLEETEAARIASEYKALDLHNRGRFTRHSPKSPLHRDNDVVNVDRRVDEEQGSSDNEIHKSALKDNTKVTTHNSSDEEVENNSTKNATRNQNENAKAQSDSDSDIVVTIVSSNIVEEREKSTDANKLSAFTSNAKLTDSDENAKESADRKKIDKPANNNSDTDDEHLVADEADDEKETKLHTSRSKKDDKSRKKVKSSKFGKNTLKKTKKIDSTRRKTVSDNTNWKISYSGLDDDGKRQTVVLDGELSGIRAPGENLQEANFANWKFREAVIPVTYTDKDENVNLEVLKSTTDASKSTEEAIHGSADAKTKATPEDINRDEDSNQKEDSETTELYELYMEGKTDTAKIEEIDSIADAAAEQQKLPSQPISDPIISKPTRKDEQQPQTISRGHSAKYQRHHDNAFMEMASRHISGNINKEKPIGETNIPEPKLILRKTKSTPQPLSTDSAPRTDFQNFEKSNLQKAKSTSRRVAASEHQSSKRKKTHSERRDYESGDSAKHHKKSKSRKVVDSDSGDSEEITTVSHTKRKTRKDKQQIHKSHSHKPKKSQKEHDDLTKYQSVQTRTNIDEQQGIRTLHHHRSRREVSRGRDNNQAAAPLKILKRKRHRQDEIVRATDNQALYSPKGNEDAGKVVVQSAENQTITGKRCCKFPSCARIIAGSAVATLGIGAYYCSAVDPNCIPGAIEGLQNLVCRNLCQGQFI